MRIDESRQYMPINGTELITRTYRTNRIQNITQGVDYLASLPALLEPDTNVIFHRFYACEFDATPDRQEIQFNLHRKNLMSVNIAAALAKMSAIKQVVVTIALSSEETPLLNTQLWISIDNPVNPNEPPMLRISSEFQLTLDELEHELHLNL